MKYFHLTRGEVGFWRDDGGVMLAVHYSVPSKIIPSPREIEVVTVEIMLKLPLILCLAYVQPH